MILIIGEKQDTARKIRSFLAPRAKWNSVSKYTGYYEDDTYCITALSGHIFTLKEPQDLNEEYKQWDLNALPLELPRNWPLQPNNKSTTYDPKIFPMIKKLWERKDCEEVIVCTDPDREGQLIWGYVEEMLPSTTAKITRAWFNEWSLEKMEEAIRNRKPNSEYKSLENAGRCRAIGDAIEGYNGTRAVTCKYGMGNNLYSIGRVQTFTQHLVYAREKEILDFKPEQYTTLQLEVESDEMPTTMLLNHKAKERLSKANADLLKSKIESEGLSAYIEKETKEVQKRPLKLYSTTSIQKEMNKKHGFEADYTLSILQKLYSPEYALTTYPRTGLEEISKSNAQLHAKNVLKHILGTGICDQKIEKAIRNNWGIAPLCVSKEETLPHEAITPVFGKIDQQKVKSLTKDEKIVYTAIVERFLQAFYPNAVFEETTIHTQKAGEVFETKGKIVKDAGFYEVIGLPDDTLLPKITDKQTYNILNVKTEEKETTPPSRYTQATLLEAMEKAGRFVENKEDKDILKETGVGTDATRAGIIKTLFNRNYIETKGKTIHPTQKTMGLFEVLPETPLTSAVSTARMESLLNQVQNGKLSMDEYFNSIDQRVNDFVHAIQKQDSFVLKSVESVDSVGCCPKCGKPIIKNKFGWGCSDWKGGCTFKIWETIAGKKLSEKHAKQLLTNNKTDFIDGFCSKENPSKKFSAKLAFKELNGEYDYDRIVFGFSQGVDNVVCPKCGKPLEENKNTVSCSDCGFTLWKNICGKVLTQNQIQQLLKGETTGVIKGFVSPRTQKKFDAKLYLDEEYNVKFLFGEKETIAICPKCGKDIIETDKAYSCSGWKEGCSSTIWKNGLEYRGIDKITKKEAKQLFEGKELLLTFRSKAGKDYKGYVKYNSDTNKLDVELKKFK